MDTFFTSVPLAEYLLDNNLTIVGTLRQNRLDMPPIMKPSKFRKVHSSEFGFNGTLSTLQDDKAVDEASAKKKPEMIQYYNCTKGGVDIMDQMAPNYTSNARQGSGQWCSGTTYWMLPPSMLRTYLWHRTPISWKV
jgi:hypothetical protein